VFLLDKEISKMTMRWQQNWSLAAAAWKLSIVSLDNERHHLSPKTNPAEDSMGTEDLIVIVLVSPGQMKQLEWILPTTSQP